MSILALDYNIRVLPTYIDAIGYSAARPGKHSETMTYPI